MLLLLFKFAVLATLKTESSTFQREVQHRHLWAKLLCICFHPGHYFFILIEKSKLLAARSDDALSFTARS